MEGGWDEAGINKAEVMSLWVTTVTEPPPQAQNFLKSQEKPN